MVSTHSLGNWIYISLISVCLLAFSCQSEETEVSYPQNDTRALVDAAHAQVDPNKITYYLNKKRAEDLRSLSETATGLSKANLLLEYNFELLKAGDSDLALAGYKALIPMLKDMGYFNGETKRKLLGLMGITYFRIAEQKNCLLNHTDDSCILPLSANAIHQDTFGSVNAIQIFESLLAEFPEDSRAKYLLNLAYMTLGKYPESVPKEYLIDPKHFKSEIDFPRFNNVAGALGVDHRGLSGGAIIDDFNNDGYLDIVCSSWGFEDNILYFENDKKGGFEDKTKQSKLTGHKGGLNINHTDYNNDGFKDIYIMRGAWMGEEGAIPNTLLQNNGDGTFKDVTLSVGLNINAPTQSSVWTDLNLDGHIDLVVVNETYRALRKGVEIWLNQGNESFKESSDSLGIKLRGFFKGVIASDMNNDGWQDLYISNYAKSNTLLINNTPASGKLSFLAFGKEAGMNRPEFSFPATFFDVNNDGWEDIFVSGYGVDTNDPATDYMNNLSGSQDTTRTPLLYLNNGGRQFVDRSKSFNLDQVVYTMGCNYGDINVDGYPDLYLGTGDPSFFSIVPNQMLLNVDGKKFVDVTFSGGFGHIQKGHGVAFGDLDNDGDQDIYAVMGGAYEGDVFQNALFENPNTSKHNWISLDLEGVKANKAAIGARVLIKVEELGEQKVFYKTVSNGSSFGGNSFRIECGLGNATKILSVSVKWPSLPSSITNYSNLELNKHYKLVEGNSEAFLLDLPTTKFSKSEGHHHHHHH